ncbi:MAG: sensor domain-containing protein [Mycolicibacterium sp.]|nr:sensor domain-containing protein [Mycolicibacterium sp.]
MRLPVALAGLFTAALALAACAQSVDGRAVAPRSRAGRPVSGADLDNILLTPSQRSDIVGAKVQLQGDVTRPVAGNPVEGPCAGLETVGMQPFIGDGFSAFDLLLSSDGTGTQHDHVVTQAAAIYPDVASATKIFATATSGLSSCDGKNVKTEAAWRFAVNDVSTDTVRWNKEQIDLPMLWVCYGQARVRINVILQAMSCQGDDGGKANADAISNRMSARVWDLSGS